MNKTDDRTAMVEAAKGVMLKEWLRRNTVGDATPNDRSPEMVWEEGFDAGIAAYAALTQPAADAVTCETCGQTQTALGGDVHCSGDCDDFSHGAAGGCHEYRPAATEVTG